MYTLSSFFLPCLHLVQLQLRQLKVHPLQWHVGFDSAHSGFCHTINDLGDAILQSWIKALNVHYHDLLVNLSLRDCLRQVDRKWGFEAFFGFEVMFSKTL